MVLTTCKDPASHFPFLPIWIWVPRNPASAMPTGQSKWLRYIYTEKIDHERPVVNLFASKYIIFVPVNYQKFLTHEHVLYMWREYLDSKVVCRTFFNPFTACRRGRGRGRGRTRASWDRWGGGSSGTKVPATRLFLELCYKRGMDIFHGQETHVEAGWLTFKDTFFPVKTTMFTVNWSVPCLTYFL